VLGRLFDTVGRKPMIAGTYIVSGVLLWVTAILFNSGDLTATTQTVAWCVIFFFASAGASAAYLTVSEIFPMETRAMAIAFFYAVGTALGGITGPLLFGRLIENASKDDPSGMLLGYGLGASLMIAAGIVEIFLGVEAAQRELEDIAKPLTAEEAEGTDVARALDMGEDKETLLDRAGGAADKLTAPTEHAGGDDPGGRT
jgi:MFS family permease